MSSKADKKILEASIINFFGKKKEYQSLSNFSVLDAVIDGVEYDSGEHCIQGEKYRFLGNIYNNWRTASEEREKTLVFPLVSNVLQSMPPRA